MLCVMQQAGQATDEGCWKAGRIIRSIAWVWILVRLNCIILSEKERMINLWGTKFTAQLATTSKLLKQFLQIYLFSVHTINHVNSRVVQYALFCCRSNRVYQCAKQLYSVPWGKSRGFSQGQRDQWCLRAAYTCKLATMCKHRVLRLTGQWQRSSHAYKVRSTVILQNQTEPSHESTINKGQGPLKWQRISLNYCWFSCFLTPPVKH